MFLLSKLAKILLLLSTKSKSYIYCTEEAAKMAAKHTSTNILNYIIYILLLMETIATREDIPLSGNHFLQQKLFVLLETAFLPFSRNHFFQWKPLTFSESSFFQQKLLLLIDGISFIGSLSFQRKPFVLVLSAKPLFLVEIIALSRNQSFQIKSILFRGSMMEAAPFNRNFSFQWKSFLLVFQNFHQQKLSEVT